jgi:hypothetical protein
MAVKIIDIGVFYQKKRPPQRPFDARKSESDFAAARSTYGQETQANKSQAGRLWHYHAAPWIVAGLAKDASGPIPVGIVVNEITEPYIARAESSSKPVGVQLSGPQAVAGIDDPVAIKVGNVGIRISGT